jgi:rhodanese-related sulfurtransferase/mannose-6-phosphate isomerase-like protein (cupin superfamily)
MAWLWRLFMQLAVQDQALRDMATPLTSEIRTHSIKRTPKELAEIASQFASSGEWLHRVRLRTEHRWYERVHLGPDHDIWVISWMPGQSTGFHDHGESSGAFIVTTGVLEEHRPGMQPVSIAPGQTRAFGTDYAHDVRNGSVGPAVSIHVYSPPLTDMTEYELEGAHLVPSQRTTRVSRMSDGDDVHTGMQSTSFPNSAISIDQMLAAARTRIERLHPEEAHKASTKATTLLVDIRPEAQRLLEGAIPGALIVERNVLEWRFDPASTARLPMATNHDIQVIVFCSEGYTSSLAAAALQELGLWRATDIIGGFQAWRRATLPTVPAAHPPSS